MSNSPPSPGPDIFFAGGECLTRFGVWVRRTDADLEEATREVGLRSTAASAIGRDSIMRDWGIDRIRAEWLNTADIEETRNILFETETQIPPWELSQVTVPEAGERGGGDQIFKLVEDDTIGQGNNTHFTGQETSKSAKTKTYTLSVDIKPDERDGIRLQGSDFLQFNTARADFDNISELEAPVLGSFGVGFTPIDATVTALESGGWFRLTFEFSSDVSTQIRIHIGLRKQGLGPSYEGDGVSGLFFSRTQLEESDVVTPYQEIPRDRDRKIAVLLLEQNRQNSWTRSEEFDDAVWTKQNCTIGVDFAQAPDGTGTGDFLREDVSNSNHRIVRDFDTGSNNIDVSWSVWARAFDRSWIMLATTRRDGTQVNTWFDVGKGRIGTQGHVSAFIRAYADGWFRCQVQDNVLAGATTPFGTMQLALDDDSQAYQGDGGSGLHIWGAQLEDSASAPFWSSYIKTVGIVAVRGFDTFLAPFGAPPVEMTMYAKFIESGTARTVSARVLTVSGDDLNPRFDIQATTTLGYLLTHVSDVGNVSTVAQFPQVPFGSLAELRAILYGDGSVQLGTTIDGGEEVVSPRTAPLALAPAWGDANISINSFNQGGGAFGGFGRYLAIKAHRGVRDRAFMRAL